MTIHVREPAPAADARWEAFVAAHPDGRIYHHPAWLQVLRAAYGYDVLAVEAVDTAGHLRGVLPLARKRGLLTGRRISSLPHTPVCGPLACDEPTLAALLTAGQELAASESGTKLQLKAEQPELHARVEQLRRTRWAVAYAMKLPEGTEQVRFGNSRNHQRIKWSVAKARKGGVVIREAATEADVRTWHRLHAGTMQAHAVPPYPLTFFLQVWRRLAPAGLARLLLAEREADGRRTVLAGSLFLMYGTTVYYAYSGMRREAAVLRPNDLIQWEAIHRACAEGYSRYDLGAVLEHDQGLVVFKRKWGAEPLTRYRYYYPPERRRRFGTPDRTELYQERGGRVRAAGNAVWRRLPLPVATTVGGWLYRNL